MADPIEGIEGQEGEDNKNNKVEERIRDLSGKVKDIAAERDAETKAKAEATDRATKAEKERDFFKGFAATTSKYPAASEYQDKIREKVMGGYDIEDATVSILAREGKLTSPRAEQKSPVGGSAVTNPVGGGDKQISEMSHEEKRKILEEHLSLG